MTMTESRTTELLGKLAEAFDDGRTFDGYFLQEYDVTADECKDLSVILSAVLQGYIAMPKPLKATLLAGGVTKDMHISADALWIAGLQLFHEEKLSRLK